MKIFGYLGLLAVIALVVHDGSFHFDRERVAAKQKHRSDQRNWSMHYPQINVFNHSSMRYLNDFGNMSDLIEPGAVVLSDLATSYFAAAELPVYAVNVHRHQGRWQRRAWARFLDGRYFCYLEFEENRAEVHEHLRKHPELKYVIVNRDGVTWHRTQDCMAHRSRVLADELPKFATLVFEGEFLDLYEIH